MFKFKKRITIEEAVATYINITSRKITESWDSETEEINSYLDRMIIDPTDLIVQFDVFLIVISLETMAVKNLRPDLYEEIVSTMIRMLGLDETYGDYAVETIIKHYLPEINYSLSKNVNPVDNLISIFIKKTNLEYNTLLHNLYMTMIVSKLGTWKKILTGYKVK